MGGLWAGNDDGFNPRIVDQCAPVTGGSGKAELFGLLLSAVFCGGADHLKSGTEFGVEHCGGCVECDGVQFPHIPCTDQANANFHRASFYR